jgi:hypothetical protein
LPALPSWATLSLLTALPLLLLLLLVLALSTLLSGTYVRSLEQSLYDSDTGSSPSSLMAQSFLSTRPNLSRIDLQLSSFPNLSGDGEIRLLTGDGTTGPVVYSAPLSAGSFAHDPYLSIAFPPIASSAGVTYTLVLQTPGYPLASALALRYNSFDVLSAGQMYTDAGPAQGDLVLSAYYHYGLPDLLADLATAISAHALEILAWLLLLLLPGLALLFWLPAGLNGGQILLAAPGLTALTLPLLVLVLRVVGLPLGSVGVWLLLLLSALAIAARFYRARRTHTALLNTSPTASSPSAPHFTSSSILFWSLLATIFVATLTARLLSLREEVAGMGLDAYHHTLIAGMIIDHGGIPSNYEPFAPLSSFTYHFGFHTLISSVAWLTGLSRPQDLLLLMPQVGQFATALPVLTLTLFGWRVLNNRRAGLLAGSLVGLSSIFPAYYVNWSRYTQGLGLALLPVAWVLFLNVVERPHIPGRSSALAPPTGPDSATHSALRNLQLSGPYMLAVIAVSGLFLTHYRIAMIFIVMAALYVAGRFLGTLRTTRTGPPTLAPLVVLRRVGLAAVLSLAALSPWLVNLLQNFRSHLAGRSGPAPPAYYDLSPLKDLLLHPTMWALYLLGALGLILAIRRRVWPLLLIALAWAFLGLWSNPYLFDWLAPGFRLPASGYLDVSTWAQSVWLPLGLLSGYLLAEAFSSALSLGKVLSSSRRRLWGATVRVLAVPALVIAGLAVALPIAFNLDSRPYIAQADKDALLWMHDNLPPGSFVLANPFRFGWSDAIYGSDSGMWVPFVAGVPASVPPLPAYNERLVDPTYLNQILDIIRYEPLASNQMQPEDWQALRDRGVTHIFVGTRSGNGGLDIPSLLASDQVTLVFQRDGAYLFQLK